MKTASRLFVIKLMEFLMIFAFIPIKHSENISQSINNESIEAFSFVGFFSYQK
jgi:hypothetical protein